MLVFFVVREYWIGSTAAPSSRTCLSLWGSFFSGYMVDILDADFVIEELSSAPTSGPIFLFSFKMGHTFYIKKRTDYIILERILLLFIYIYMWCTPFGSAYAHLFMLAT